MIEKIKCSVCKIPINAKTKSQNKYCQERMICSMCSKEVLRKIIFTKKCGACGEEFEHKNTPNPPIYCNNCRYDKKIELMKIRATERREERKALNLPYDYRSAYKKKKFKQAKIVYHKVKDGTQRLNEILSYPGMLDAARLTEKQEKSLAKLVESKCCCN